MVRWNPWTPITITVEYDILGTAWCASSEEPEFLLYGSNLEKILSEARVRIEEYVTG